MRNALVCLSGIVVFGLTACSAVGPDYVRPELSMPEKWNVAYTSASDLVNTRWWQQFNDPVLDSLITEAVRNNLDLRVATARVDQYLGALETTRSQYFPQVEGGINAAREHSSGTTVESSRAALSASWELDLWGRVRRSSEVAQARVAGSEAGRRAVLLTVVSNVAKGYITLCGLDRQLEIALETEKSYLETLHLFQLRYNHGAISQLELSQVESQYESARQAIPGYESQIRQQENLLSLLLGRLPGPIARGKTLEKLQAPGLPEGLPSSLLERRPDVVEAEQTLVAANAGIGVAKAEYFPRISLTGLLGTASSDIGNLLSTGTGVWSLAGAGTAPLLHFGAISGQIKQAESEQQQALFEYQRTVLQSFREVEDVLIQIVKGRQEVEAQEKQLRALEEYARLAHLQFDAGTSSYLQVLDAERSLFSNRLSLARLKFTLLSSHVDAYKVMGGGWLTEADQRRVPPQG